MSSELNGSLSTFNTTFERLYAQKGKANIYSDSLQKNSYTEGSLVLFFLNKIALLFGIRKSHDEVFKGWMNQIASDPLFITLNDEFTPYVLAPFRDLTVLDTLTTHIDTITQTLFNNPLSPTEQHTATTLQTLSLKIKNQVMTKRESR